MQGLTLVLAAVLGMQQPGGVRQIAPALARAQAALHELGALDRLDALDALEALDIRDVTAWQSEQDPTDSLWRAARRAFNRGDYASAANLYGDLVRRYPAATHAGDALYWAAFALYKNDDLGRARSLLVSQQRRYPKAATLRDGDALLARIQAALAKQGDEEAARWLAEHAQPAQAAQPAQPAVATQPASGRGCPEEDDDDDVRVAALNGLLQMDAGNALPILKKVLGRRDTCSAGLRRKAVFIVSQERGADTEDVLLDVARNDPDAEVRQQAVFWLSQVGSDRAVSALDSILRTATDPELQDKAIFSLSQIHNARAAQILRDYAANERAPDEVREKAIFWLGQQHTPENAGFLRALYGRLTGEDLKERVIFSSAHLRVLATSRGGRARQADPDREERAGQGTAEKGGVLAGAIPRPAGGAGPAGDHQPVTSRLTLALALVTAPAVGQDIGARVAAAPDGTVRLSSGSASPATRAPWRSSRSF